MDTPEIIPNEAPPAPFRHEVTTQEFETIESARKTLEAARGIFDTSDEKPIVAQLGLEFMVDPATPNEVKMEAYKQTLDLITSTAERPQNIEVSKAIIDMIRAQQDPGLRLRLLGIAAQHLDAGSLFEQYKNGDIDLEAAKRENDIIAARRDALTVLSADSEALGAHRAWAGTILNPPEVVDVYKWLYSHGVELTITPRIQEEIVDIDDHAEHTEPSDAQPTVDELLVGEIVTLPVPYLPSPEKVARWKEATGRDLPLRLLRNAGDTRYATIDFPSDDNAQAAKLVEEFRAGEISRKEVYDQARGMIGDFLGRMNPQQRAELEQHNIEVRFTTERGIDPNREVTSPLVQQSEQPTSQIPA